MRAAPSRCTAGRAARRHRDDLPDQALVTYVVSDGAGTPRVKGRFFNKLPLGASGAGQTCTHGACAPMVGCPAPGVMCGTRCTVLDADSVNCGVCGHSCIAGQRCTDGACALITTCPAPAVYCGGLCTL